LSAQYCALSAESGLPLGEVEDKNESLWLDARRRPPTPYLQLFLTVRTKLGLVAASVAIKLPSESLNCPPSVLPFLAAPLAGAARPRTFDGAAAAAPPLLLRGWVGR
jgi:hypothetical protein